MYRFYAFDNRSRFIDQPLGRGQRFLDLFKLYVTKTGNVAELNELALQLHFL